MSDGDLTTSGALIQPIKKIDSSFRLRMMLAQVVSLSGTYLLLQSLLTRFLGGFILAFHSLKPERFIHQVEALRPNRPVPLSDLIMRAKNGQTTSGLFAITFDDGVGETVRAIAEAAAKRDWPVSFFLPTDYLDNPAQGMLFQWWQHLEPFLPCARIHLPDLGDFDLSSNLKLSQFRRHVTNLIYTRPISECGPLIWGLVDFSIKGGYAKKEWIRTPAPITWDEVSRLSRNSVIEFGSHGVSHSPLSSLSVEQLEQELVISKRRISEATNLPCRNFCYPFGGSASIGDIAPRTVAKYYESALTMRRGRIGRPQSLYLLPRIPLYPRDDANMARLKVLTK